MKLPDCDSQILKLTDLFYKTYPNPPCLEILKKQQRAYNCILFQTHYDYYICVPYRTEIGHTFAYHFKNSKRSRAHKSGLDYTKIVIINKNEYVDSKDALVDKDEYNETMMNHDRIKGEALEFVEDYVAHMNATRVLHQREFQRRYGYSSLKYFHKELGIKTTKMTEVKFYDDIDDGLLKFAVIISRASGKWVFCKHKERDTYEVPGGHREKGESILEAAKRELREETGAIDFSMQPICIYSVKGNTRLDEEVEDETFGMLFMADIFSFEEIHSEIEKIIITEDLVENWTYPLIQPKLLEEARNRGYL